MSLIFQRSWNLQKTKDTSISSKHTPLASTLCFAQGKLVYVFP